MDRNHIFTPAERDDYPELAEIRGLRLPADVDERDMIIRSLVAGGQLPDSTE